MYCWILHFKTVMKCNSVDSLEIGQAFFVLILYLLVTIFANFLMRNRQTVHEYKATTKF